MKSIKRTMEVDVPLCDGCDVPIERSATDDTQYTSLLTITFGYGTKRDGDVGHYVFCAACSEILIDAVLPKFPNMVFPEREQI